jgi:hypothetical protein
LLYKVAFSAKIHSRDNNLKHLNINGGQEIEELRNDCGPKTSFTR